MGNFKINGVDPDNIMSKGQQVDRIYSKGTLVWENIEEVQAGQITMTTISTSSSWSPSGVTNSGATLHWEVTGAATYSVDTDTPIFNFSTPGEKIITITSADNLTGLQTLVLHNNQLTSFDATGLTGLQTLVLSDNQLTSFDATGLTELQSLYLSNNQLTSFDATGLTGLQSLYFADNQLTSFDATGLTELQSLYLYNNQLTSFDATGLTGLQHLDLLGNQLTSFDATGLTGLQHLNLSHNQLPTTVINSVLDQLITIGNASGKYLTAKLQVGGGCGDPAKIAALDAIWETVLVDACPWAPTFPEVTIGTQTWMSVNLDIDDGLGGIYAYNNNEANVATYGRLYTWDAAVRVAASIDGWHLPSDAEWTTLTDYLGGVSVAGGKLKETGTTHWLSPNTGATNSSRFTALPGGYRYYDGSTFNYIGGRGYWWSATEYNAGSALYRNMDRSSTSVTSPFHSKEFGFSVRLIRD